MQKYTFTCIYMCIYMYIHTTLNIYPTLATKILKAEKDSWFHSKTHVMSTPMIWEQTEKQQKFPADDSSCKKLLRVYFDYLFCN